MQSDGTWSSLLDSINWLCCPLCLGRRQISYKRPANRPASFAFKPTSLFPLFARLHLFCFIYLLIRITAMADRRLGSETTPWNTLGSRVTRETKTYYFTVGGIIQSTIIRHGYTQWMQKTKPRDISVGWHWKRDWKKKKNYSSVIRKWVSSLLSYIIHV